MKVRAFTVTFTREIEITVFAPEDATEDEIEALAEDEDVDAYDMPDWEIAVSGGRIKHISDDECALGKPNQYGYRSPVDGAFRKVDVVVNDARDGFGDPSDSDARWWCLSTTKVDPTFFPYGGHMWAVSTAIVVREDFASLTVDDWVGEVEPETLGGVFRSASTTAFGLSCFDEKYRALLSSGTVYGCGLEPHRVVREDETIAIVMPMRGGAGSVKVVDGKVLP